MSLEAWGSVAFSAGLHPVVTMNNLYNEIVPDGFDGRRYKIELRLRSTASHSNLNTGFQKSCNSGFSPKVFAKLLRLSCLGK